MEEPTLTPPRNKAKEIKSPAPLASSLSLQRKKLGSHFLESDERRRFYGATSSAAAVGTTPLDIRGLPIPERDLPRTGGWVAAFFIFGNETAERMAYYGLSVNMVVFMFKVMHLPFAASANAVNNFLGISQASSVLGGFLADAYLGRYWTIAAFTTLYLLGLIALTLCATLPALVPGQEGCDKLAMLLGGCASAQRWQMAYLYTALYVTAFGAAGIRPCVSSFGADQFDDRSAGYKRRLDRFFNLFYLAVTVGAIAAFTLVVYIQMHRGWAAAFGALALAMGASNALFFAGTPLYRHKAPGGSPLTRVAQVLVAAFRKRGADFGDGGYVGLYEVAGAKSAIRGSGKIEHTDDFRWLDKAALRLDDLEGEEEDPWRLCTVTQVEEVKILVRLLPVPACTVMLSVVLTEFLTLSVQQAYTLNTGLLAGAVHLPVTCMPVFPCLAIFLVLALYAVEHGYLGLFLSPMPGLSAYWLLIQYCLIGIAEVFCLVGLIEFLYQEAPDAMRSVGSAYAAVAGGMGCFMATALNNAVDAATGDIRSGRPSWVAQNINVGRFDYLYWLLAVLSTVNFAVFLYFASIYKYRTPPPTTAGGNSSKVEVSVVSDHK
ncbi:protein NRT1/ PTR FAMILY 6.1-like isoform X2 [Triticum dicoccoides]|uniref:protein NRT1/ PTR FAMILY 6.1-like isoform X2 n=1 Tax=Triticum dicoccoides TaxID=85692 RepID=UPI00188DCA27|nr:protein NRT1/ PTR FAMILY 6.1-like isoform X2 [Triticum dicoccoides]